MVFNRNYKSDKKSRQRCCEIPPPSCKCDAEESRPSFRMCPCEKLSLLINQRQLGRQPRASFQSENRRFSLQSFNNQECPQVLTNQKPIMEIEGTILEATRVTSKNIMNLVQKSQSRMCAKSALAHARRNRIPGGTESSSDEENPDKTYVVLLKQKSSFNKERLPIASAENGQGCKIVELDPRRSICIPQDDSSSEKGSFGRGLKDFIAKRQRRIDKVSSEDHSEYPKGRGMGKMKCFCHSLTQRSKQSICKPCDQPAVHQPSVHQPSVHRLSVASQVVVKKKREKCRGNEVIMNELFTRFREEATRDSVDGRAKQELFRKFKESVLEVACPCGGKNESSVAKKTDQGNSPEKGMNHPDRRERWDTPKDEKKTGKKYDEDDDQNKYRDHQAYEKGKIVKPVQVIYDENKTKSEPDQEEPIKETIKSRDEVEELSNIEEEEEEKEEVPLEKK